MQPEQIPAFLRAEGCTETNNPLCFPIRLHAIPGAGKTTLLRKLRTRFPSALIYAAAHSAISSPDDTHLLPLPDQPNPCLAIDEYQILTEDDPWLTQTALLVGDPCQTNHPCPPAHFRLDVSHRFGHTTAALLTELGFPCTSSHSDTVVVLDAYDSEPSGTIIALDDVICKTLLSHGTTALHPEQVRGRTFSAVSLYVSQPLASAERHLLYIALTRHTHLLEILTTIPLTFACLSSNRQTPQPQ
jgi:hypothetical protein